MRALPRRVLWYGQEAPLPEARELRAGPLTLLLEEGSLRYVRLGSREILRQVYGAVRDRNWNTLPGALSNLRVEAGESSFEASFDVRCGDVFSWTGTITGAADGRVVFRFDGEARSTFLRNRVGICVLHPIAECAGGPCRVTHADGMVEDGVFPRLVSPHQPFKDIRAIAHPVAAGCEAEVRFDGEVFEMEDQRNWTDASFKTYSTPLALPFPVEIRAGTRITQTVTLEIKGRVPKLAAPAKEVVLTVGPALDDAPRLPRIGLGASGVKLTRRQAARLRALRLDHLRVDLDLGDPRWESTLAAAEREAKAAGAGLCVGFHPAPAAEVDRLAKRLASLRVPPSVLALDAADAEEAWRALRLSGDGAKGLGTRAYFAELNRSGILRRPSTGASVVFSINPQVHAADLRTLVETLAAQGDTLISARDGSGKRDVIAGPITLKPRFNPNATGAETERDDALPSTVDPRQMSLFGAGWTLGSLKRLAEHRPHALTYYETIGWRGVMEADAGPPKPELFPSIPGGVFPLYHVFADIAGFARARPAGSSHPLQAEVFAFHDDRRLRVLAANLTAAPLRVGLSGLPGRFRLRRLNDTNAERAMAEPEAYRAEGDVEAGGDALELLPFEVVRIEVT